MPPRILPLSEDAISQIHSSKQITSLPGVVIALLENALDADATKVDISVNFTRGSCVIEDNGHGIPSAEFSEHGGLGKMHHTSKATPELPLHGNAGTYLASLAALSLVSATSRHHAGDVSATLSMHQGRVIARHVPSPSSNQLTAFGTHGTRVAVHDLFGNMPVRVKQRALVSAQGSSTADRSWLDLKCNVSALLLAWRKPCSVKLRDSESHGRNLTLSGTHSTVSSALTERNLNSHQGKVVKYDLRDALPIVFQAGLAPFESRVHWIPVTASTSKISCHGLICLDPAPTRLCQFVSIGIQPSSSGSGHSAIYEAINKMFSNSSFGTVDDPREEILSRRSQRPESFAQKQTRTSKSVDRWPMFVLQVKLKDSHGSSAREPENHQLQNIVDVLQVMIEQWLTANNFRPRRLRKRAREASASPRDGPESPSRAHPGSNAPGLGSPNPAASDQEHSNSAKKRRVLGSAGKETSANESSSCQHSNVDHLSRIKSGRRVTNGSMERNVESALSSTAARSSHFALPPLEPGSLSGFYMTTSHDATTSFKFPAQILPDSPSTGDYGSVSDTDLLQAATAMDGGPKVQLHGSTRTATNDTAGLDHVVEWTDPVTKEVFKVNTRTGIVLPPEDRPGTSTSIAQESSNLRPASVATAMTAAGRPLTLNGRARSASTSGPQSAMPTFLAEWQNPVFSAQSEQSIPVANVSGPAIEAAQLEGKFCAHKSASDYFATSGHGTQSKLSKASLQSVRIINQVDAKYILCSMSAERASQTLVLVDQHAASERIILESLLKDLCSPMEANSPAVGLQTNTGCSSLVNTAVLDTPIVFEITAEESDMLHKQSQLFAQYGILYDLYTTSQTRTHYTFAARTLPPGIAERCKLFPKLLIDLVRSTIWSNLASSRTTAIARPPTVPGQEHSWLDRIGSCPKALLEMLNSRACRSAVMFNDVLSVRECENLMAGLAKCAFPFMCAHGRVSMVPIGSLGTDGEEAESVFGSHGASLQPATEATNYKDAFRRWKTANIMASGNGKT